MNRKAILIENEVVWMNRLKAALPRQDLSML